MNAEVIHICSFSGSVAELPENSRTESAVLKALKHDPRISTWDRADHYEWLDPILESLIEQGKIVDITDQVQFPWHKYEVVK